MLVVENLVKKYGKFHAVDKLSFEIGRGHIYGFVGANGAGKTTTMKIIAGLLKPTSGKVEVDGVDVAGNPCDVKRKIGYMPDFFGVYDDLKVSEYMDFYAGVYGIPRGERHGISYQMLELVNLSGKHDQYVDELSRGMKQRLCLARSLIHNPQLLILDEPASGLDPRARVEMKEVLKTLKDMGKTILISSHILPELAELCTSIGIIERGRMIVSGTVDEIMKRVLQNSIIRIRVLGEIDPAVRYLKEQPAVVSVTAFSDCIDAGFTGGPEEQADILAGMTSSGIRVVSFAEMQGSLESVFMQLMKGGAADADKSDN